MQLEGLGVRDLHLSGDKLYIPAGPTRVLDGEIRVFQWTGAKPLLAANQEPMRFQIKLTGENALHWGFQTCHWQHRQNPARKKAASKGGFLFQR